MHYHDSAPFLCKDLQAHFLLIDRFLCKQKAIKSIKGGSTMRRGIWKRISAMLVLVMMVGSMAACGPKSNEGSDGTASGDGKRCV